MKTESQNETPLDGAGTAARSHAVVIGEGMAGLLAGRVLADHFDCVTILERDRLPGAPAPRKGAPQSRHIHVLLDRGRGILERFFPGLAAELRNAGVRLMDVDEDFIWLTPAGWSPRFHSGLEVPACSRELLEWTIRQRLKAHDGVRIIEGVEVTDLVANGDNTAVVGVTTHRRGVTDAQTAAAEDPHETRLDANLVVDASGRGSNATEWLTRLGYSAPEESMVNASLGYASRLYRRPAATSFPWECVYIQVAPPDRTRGGVIFPIEGDRWIVTLGGGGGDHPPTDEAGFHAFMASLPSPVILESVREAEPITPIFGYRATENRWRHYERLARRPEGLLVLGDSACTFNPVYGQGMTTAALGALTLKDCLDRQARKRPSGDLSGLAERFQRALAKVNATPWLLSTSEDQRYPSVVGVRPTRATRWMHWYLDRLVRRSTGDADLRRRLLEVFHLQKAPSILFRPRLLGRLPLRRSQEPALP